MKKNSYRVLVTGAYGFLGNYVVKELLDNNYTVVAFGRNKQKMLNLKKQYPTIELIYGDLCNPSDCKKALKGIDAVTHLGALSTVWGKRSDFIKTNVEGTKNILEGCRKNGVKK